MEAELTRVLSDLIAIESVNPAYPGGGRGEADVADYVSAYCRRLGLDVTRQLVLPGRENVLALLSTPGASETVVFEAHMDTVGLEPMGDRALQPDVRDGRVYGRGACDTKGSLASMLIALRELVGISSQIPVNVLLLATVDEEYHYRGVLRFVEGDVPAHTAIVGEPTNLRVVVATKGCVRCQIATTGKAAHSSRPDEGINAIDQMADVLLALRALPARLRQHHHPLVGSPTFSVGRVWGGTGVNVVPDRCVVEVDRRTIPGEDPDGVLSEIDALLAEVRRVRPRLQVERLEPFVIDWALETSVNAAVVQAIGDAAQRQGLSGDAIGVPYGSDASKFQRFRGIPAVVFGPGSIDQAHTADEYVPIDDLIRAAAIYRDAARLL